MHTQTVKAAQKLHKETKIKDCQIRKAKNQKNKNNTNWTKKCHKCKIVWPSQKKKKKEWEEVVEEMPKDTFVSTGETYDKSPCSAIERTKWMGKQMVN